MKDGPEEKSLRERLIEAGIEEINVSGFRDFSVRRIAGRCGVSCAAPYKHFADKQSYILAILEHINEDWAARQAAVAARYPGSYRTQLIETCLEYIRFMVENPYFRSVILLKYEDYDRRYSSVRNKLTLPIYEIADGFCREVGMPEDVKLQKKYILRSLIYGAALMFDNGELAYNRENMDMVADSIRQEFSRL